MYLLKIDIRTGCWLFQAVDLTVVQYERVNCLAFEASFFEACSRLD